MENISEFLFGRKDIVIQYNLPPKKLKEISIKRNLGVESDSGALSVNTGKFKGRSPKNRFIVKDNITKDKVNWGKTNIPFPANYFDSLFEKLKNYLISKKEVFVRDCFLCQKDYYRVNLRVVNEKPWANIFAYNMFVRPEENELKDFAAQWVVYSAPGFQANPKVDHTNDKNFVIINFSKQVVIVGGTGYTGEIKKGMFSMLNFILPSMHNVLPMHCSANVSTSGQTNIFFGLSGTGKTTLSNDSKKKLIGDDEHGWTDDNTIFNFEGGCYAKVYGLKKELEPDIFNAIKDGALLENVVLKANNEVDYFDASITENTRVSYPIDYIKNITNPSIGKNPKNVFFLTADAFGVLPPISRLTPGQAAFHFISGYTSKLAGTEEGIINPQPSFSECFGAPFMPMHPTLYAKMLMEKIKTNHIKVWMVNTGWTGGPYGVGKRIKLSYTRQMIYAAENGFFGDICFENYHTHTVFRLAMPRTCPKIPDDVLSPRRTWNNDKAYYKQAYALAESFIKNFKQFEIYSNAEIIQGAPIAKPLPYLFKP